jgi:energy-coupling factor transporter ATP-binding protein EcfA2
MSQIDLNIHSKELGRNHSVPKEYTYLLHCSDQGTILDLLRYSSYRFLGNIDAITGNPYVANGYNKIEGIDTWVINQIKQKYYYFWFKNRSDAIILNNILVDKKVALTPPNKSPIYKFTRKGWETVDSFEKLTIDSSIGYKEQVNKIIKDISNYEKNKVFLKSIGEGNRSLNYLLHGPPGTGKSTLIKSVASILNLSIYIVNGSLMEQVNVSTVLNPPCKENKIILFEDFDRYLQEEKFVMSDILNELDGISTSNNCIRFFTANNEKIIYEHDALINRMSSKFKYGYPIKEHFIIKLKTLLSFYDNEFDADKIDEFVNLVIDKNITLRPFTNYVIRYLFDENVLEKLISNINELIE